VTNNTTNSTEALTLTSLSDDKFGDLNGQGNCAVPQTLAANGGTFSCSFQQSLPAGDPATPHVNTVTATAQNNAGTTDTATDEATVNFTEILLKKKTSRRKSGVCLSLGSNPRARFAA
jgi:hypothetical protein